MRDQKDSALNMPEKAIAKRYVFPGLPTMIKTRPSKGA
jgi:hypothetical protein